MENKVTNQLQVEVPQNGFVDEGEGVVSFPNGLTITDGSVQRNGTRYDIESLDLSVYGGQITGDHRDELGNLIGQAIGTVKTNGKVVVNKIRYAINENPYARLAYNLLIGGFSKNFSTETIGPAPDHEGIYWNAELVGLSQVVTQNNYNARVNAVIHNSLEQSKKDGFDVEGIEEKVVNDAVQGERKMEEKSKETETLETETNNLEAEEVSKDETAVEEAPVKNEVEEESKETPEAEKETVEEEESKDEEQSETKTETEEKAENEAPSEEEKEETNNEEEKMEEKDKTVETPSVDANAIAEAVNNALKPLTEKVEAMEVAQKNAFDASAKEPEFTANEGDDSQKATNKYATMDFADRYQAQVDAAWNAVKLGNIESWNTLREINQVNLDALKEEGIARNAMTLEDLGNFVIAPEMYNEIVGHRSDYTAILDATEWRETDSLEFAWLQRTGDIDMKNVAMGESNEVGEEDVNLKPISEYSATPKKSALEELAAVSVVATSATRFAAVDLLADAAAGYRNDYDRKRAQLVIAKLQGAVNNNGFSVDYAPAEDVDALTAWIEAVTEISDTTLNGVLVFNARTFAELKSRALRAGANGPLSEILTTGDLPTVFGYRFIVVPNDLMPSLGGSETIAHEVEGTPVSITHSVFFADLTTFTGRTSGGLQYDVSNSAPYEVNGVTRSAYQRNELVLRGSFFRGGAVRDEAVVSGIVTATAS